MYEVNVPMMRDYIYGSADNVDWFMKHGVKFDVIRMTPWEEATWHVIGEYKGKNHGAALCCQFEGSVRQARRDNAHGHAGRKSITDKSGAVVGVKAKSKTDDYTINAKAVILASGSISDSNEKWLNGRIVTPNTGIHPSMSIRPATVFPWLLRRVLSAVR